MASSVNASAMQASTKLKAPHQHPETAHAQSKVNTSFKQVVVPFSTRDSFDAARERIDSTGLGRPRIDSSVDLGNQLDPPTPDSSSRKNASRTRTDGGLGFDANYEVSPSYMERESDRSLEAVSEPPTRRVEQHKAYSRPSAPILRPTRPLPHQRKCAMPAPKKRGASEELHTSSKHGAR